MWMFYILPLNLNQFPLYTEAILHIAFLRTSIGCYSEKDSKLVKYGQMGFWWLQLWYLEHIVGCIENLIRMKEIMH